MDLTRSYVRAVPESIRQRYVWFEVRNAAAIIASTNPKRWDQVLAVLDWFELTTDDLVQKGGQESDLAARVNNAFRTEGWREARVDTEIELSLELRSFKGDPARSSKTRVKNRGFLVDNMSGRIALDVEWNAKDGNLSRDIAAYRALYDYGLIDAAVILTRTQPDLRQLAYQLALLAGLPDDEAKKRLGTTTTTNLDKLLPMMTRGDSGGCPLLAVAICHRTWRGSEQVVIDQDEVSPRAWKESQSAKGDVPEGGAGIS